MRIILIRQRSEKEREKKSLNILCRFSGPQIKTHGWSSAIRRVWRRDETADQQSDCSVGRKFGETSLWTIPTQMLHGQFTKWRITKSKGKND